MYPLKFENIYYEKIWGGRGLKAYRKNLPDGKIGESWDIACRKNTASIIQNGKYRGKTIFEIICELKKKILGSSLYKEGFSECDFPLLVKIIDTDEKLSVQVHPDDEYARLHEGDNGKLEAWYVVDCIKGAKIVLGIDGCSKNEFPALCREGSIESYMNEIEVEPGDLYLIKPGMLHSIGRGITIAEFQQNSDITYRVYDYGRGRELNLEKALDVIDFSIKPEKSGYGISMAGLNIEAIQVDGSYPCRSCIDKFNILTVVEGSGSILYMDYGIRKSMEINMLETILIPAYMGEYILNGKLKVIKCAP